MSEIETQKMVLERGPNVKRYPSYERYIGPFADDREAEVYINGRQISTRGLGWPRPPYFRLVDLLLP